MSILTISKNPKIIPRFKAMSPYEIYKSQVQACIENIRYTAQGIAYTPSQLGGLQGQLQALNENVVLQQIEFRIE